MFAAFSKFKILTSYDLKIIALFSMIIDHVGMIFFPESYYLRIIGRIAFMLYAFMLVEGVFYTRNVEKYKFKVLLWAFLSEIPFDLANHRELFYLNNQNIFFTLFIGLIGLDFFHRNKEDFIANAIVGIFCMFLAFYFKVDYSWYGVALIFTFYWMREAGFIKYIFAQGLGMLYSFLQYFAYVGFVPLMLYNGKEGKKIGNIYYSFYAIHLLVLYLIARLLQGL